MTPASHRSPLAARAGLLRHALLVLLALTAACVADVPAPVDPGDLQDQPQAPPPAFVDIPAASFLMGSTDFEFGHERDELQHEVTLSRPFLMQSVEVTQRQWEDLMGNNPSRAARCPDCPVDSVSWFDALSWLNRLSERDGLDRCFVLEGCVGVPGVDLLCQSALSRGVDCAGWRLPTEAEWEFAARAGSETDFYNGFITDPFCADSNLAEIGWYCGNSSDRSQPVASKTPNAFGLFDMSGNVFEWVWDLHGPYSADPAKDPTGPPQGTHRVGRGGGWFSLATECRAARRSAEEPNTRSPDFGFRPVRTSR